MPLKHFRFDTSSVYKSDFDRKLQVYIQPRNMAMKMLGVFEGLLADRNYEKIQNQNETILSALAEKESSMATVFGRSAKILNFTVSLQREGARLLCFWQFSLYE